MVVVHMVDVSDVLSAFALALSGYAVWLGRVLGIRERRLQARNLSSEIAVALPYVEQARANAFERVVGFRTKAGSFYSGAMLVDRAEFEMYRTSIEAIAAELGRCETDLDSLSGGRLERRLSDLGRLKLEVNRLEAIISSVDGRLERMRDVIASLSHAP